MAKQETQGNRISVEQTFYEQVEESPLDASLTDPETTFAVLRCWREGRPLRTDSLAHLAIWYAALETGARLVEGEVETWDGPPRPSNPKSDYVLRLVLTKEANSQFSIRGTYVTQTGDRLEVCRTYRSDSSARRNYRPEIGEISVCLKWTEVPSGSDDEANYAPSIRGPWWDSGSAVTVTSSSTECLGYLAAALDIFLDSGKSDPLEGCDCKQKPH